MARMYISERPPVPIKAMRDLVRAGPGAAAASLPVSGAEGKAALAELDSAVLTMRVPFEGVNTRPGCGRWWCSGMAWNVERATAVQRTGVQKISFVGEKAFSRAAT
jgi:hypothetical protein